MNKSYSQRFSSLLLVILSFGVLASALAAPVVSEKIIFLDENGIDYVRYDTTRTSHHSYEILFNKKANTNPEQHLKDYLYIYPKDYQWDHTSNAKFDLMKIASGSYATLMQKKLSLDSELSIDDNGVYTYTNWNGETKTDDKHFGIWNKPDNFTKLVYAWVFPKNFSVLSYTANRSGKWINRNNTITYYGNNVNDLVFTIQYQPRSNTIYRELAKDLNKESQIQLKQDAQGVKITMAATVLFSSGSSDLSKGGKSILRALSRTLSKRDDINIIIDGHSDNIAIKGSLAKKYKTNWELSSSRSLTVLHYLAENKLPESHLVARAFGSTKPIASNNTPQGQAQNRRIEILIMNATK